MIRSIRHGFWVSLVVAALVATACGDGSSDASPTIADVDVDAEPVDATVVPEPTAAAEQTGRDDAATTADAEPVTQQPEFPLEFFGRTLGFDGFGELAGGRLVNISGPLLSTHGESADMTFALPDLRVEGASTECGGEVHEGPFVTNTDVVTNGTISLAPLGTLDVEFTHTSTVFNTETGAPFCDEQIGVWTASDGELEGATGTIHRLRMGDTERITLSL